MINNQIVNVNEDPTVLEKGDCKSVKRKFKWFSLPGTNRKFKCLVSLQGNVPWGAAADAKTKSYKKKNNRYYKSRFWIYAALDGNSKGRPRENCNTSTPLTLVEEYKNRKKVKVKFRWWGESVLVIPYDSNTGLFDIISFHNRLNLNPWQVKL